MCCACEACKKDQIKTKLMASMPFEVRCQTQVYNALNLWFLNRLVDLEYRLKKTESYIADKLVAEVTKPDKNISWRLEDR